MKRTMSTKGSNKRMNGTFQAQADHCEVDVDEYLKTEEIYNEWLELAPDSAEPRCQYAAFLERQQRYDDAKAMVQESIEIEPNYFTSRTLLASILEHLGDMTKSIDTLSFAYAFLSEQANSNELGVLLCNRGNLHRAMYEADKAISDYREGLKMFPKLHNAQWDLGTILKQKGDFVGAQAHFDLAVRYNINLTKQQGQSYIRFLLDPVFENQYDECCQAASFPCHNICMAVTEDLMFLSWSKLTPGLRNYVRNACTNCLNHVIPKYKVSADRYRQALRSDGQFPAMIVELVVAFIMGDASTFEF